MARRATKARQEGKKVVVVVSARGDTTDELIELARQISERPPAREMDMLLSTGEQISIALMAMAIHAQGQEAIGARDQEERLLRPEQADGTVDRELEHLVERRRVGERAAHLGEPSNPLQQPRVCSKGARHLRTSAMRSPWSSICTARS